ncbi:MAG: aspartate kinase, partial [Stackebrandtia sp.]
GTSVADVDHIRSVAAHVKREVDGGHACAVVVSAMAGATNQLVALVEQAWGFKEQKANGGDPAQSAEYDGREYDAVVSSGEQVTSGLLALVLQSLGVKARSWQGWQIPLHTDAAHRAARITGLDVHEIKGRMLAGEVAVVAGFQGIAPGNRVSTLGRGGSDTTAVALAAALFADICEIYSDVDGVYSADPRIVPNAKRVEQITYEEMLELAASGAKILHLRAVEYARRSNIPLRVRSSYSTRPGTLVTGSMEDLPVEQALITGVAHDRSEAKVTALAVPDEPGQAAELFRVVAEAEINIDMIVQNISTKGNGRTDISFTLPKDDGPTAMAALQKAKEQIGFTGLLYDDHIGKVSLVGAGMR